MRSFAIDEPGSPVRALYATLCDAWESICTNSQLYFFWKENTFVWVVWCEQRAVRRQVSVPAPLLKRPSCQTGALDYHHLQANMYFSKLGETAILSENLKKEKKTEVKAQHYNSFLFIKYICFVLVVEILIFNMFPAEVFFWDNSDLERKPNAIFLGGGAGLTIQQITNYKYHWYLLLDKYPLHLHCNIFLSNFCVQYSVTEAS